MPRRVIRLLLACGLAVLIGACAPRISPPEVQVGLLLSEVDILQALFQSAAVPIATDPFCAGIAASDTRTIGRFIAGLLAVQERDRSNWVRAETSQQYPPDWTMDVLFVSEAANPDSLVWGVRFQIASGGHRMVDPASFRCFTYWPQ